MCCIWIIYSNVLYMNCIFQCVVYEFYISICCIRMIYFDVLYMNYTFQCAVHKLYIYTHLDI